MIRLSRFVAVAVTAMALQASLAGVAWAQASEDARTADITTSVPPKAGEKPVIWQQPLDTYDNGPLITHVAGGCAGSDASRLQSSSLLMSTLGFTASTATVFRIADNFTVTAPGWTINKITFFGYQTNSTTTSTFNTARVQIWGGGAPNAGGTVVFGDTTTNRFLATAFSNIYRDTETTVANCARPIMTVDATIATSLAPGTYWVDFALGGTLASGPFIPPTTVTGSNSPCTPCNALQWNGTTWNALNDTGSGTQQDVKFVVDYIPVPVELQSFQVE